MGWRNKLSIGFDIGCLICLSYYICAMVWPNTKINYVYQFSIIWGYSRGFYIIASSLCDEAYGSYYDHDAGGYRSFGDNHDE